MRTRETEPRNLKNTKEGDDLKERFGNIYQSRMLAEMFANGDVNNDVVNKTSVTSTTCDYPTFQ